MTTLIPPPTVSFRQRQWEKEENRSLSEVPKTAAKMREEVSMFDRHRSGRSARRKSKSKLGLERNSKKQIVGLSSNLPLAGIRRAKVSQRPNLGAKDLNPLVKENEENINEKQKKQDELDKKRTLWRTFRRKMSLEQRHAIEHEKIKLQESDAALQWVEQEEEFAKDSLKSTSLESMSEVDSRKERSRYGLLLPKMLTSNQVCSPESMCIKSTDSIKDSVSIDGGFWEFLNIFTGKQLKDDTSTASTSEVTSLASDYTIESEHSWQTWQSFETTKVNNCTGTRELLMKYYGGESDDPWLAAKRGDLATLELRWKYRHDWTLEDEHGNTPLYYACRYGGAKNLRVVFFLLQQWPSTQRIPIDIMVRCKADAANLHVREILNNPNRAEWIIHEFEENCSHIATQDDESDDSEDDEPLFLRRYGRQFLYGIHEIQEDEC